MPKALCHLFVAAATLLAAHGVPADANAQAAPAAAERALRDLVHVMNLGNRDSLEGFVSQRFVVTGPGGIPVGDRVERLARLHSIFGELTLRNVDSVGATRASGLAQSTRTESGSCFTSAPTDFNCSSCFG